MTEEIPVKPKVEASTSNDGYKDPDVLEELYYGERLSTREIARRFGVSGNTIHYWMDKLGVDRRNRSESGKLVKYRRPASYSTDIRGYERWRTHYNGEKEPIVSVHRLLAVSEFGFEETCDMVVHHKNGIPWDNRPENIELMSNSKHSSMHRKESTHRFERDDNGKITGWEN